MRKNTNVIIWLISLSIFGCSHGYRATGHLDGLDVLLAGKADLALAGGGRFTLASPARDLICAGIAHPPTNPSPAPGCRGEIGKGELRCTDGRHFSLQWQAITCRAFGGAGSDDFGNKLRFSVENEPH